MATFMRLLGFLRPYRRGVVLSGALAACAMAMTAAIPWLTGRAIDQMRQGDRSGLRTLAFAVLAAGVLRLALTVVPRLIAGRVSLGVVVHLRERIYGHVQSRELAFFDRQQTGQLMSRATVDLQSVRFFLGYGLIFMLQSGLTILFAAVAMFATSPGLATISLAPVPFVVFIAARYGRRSRPALQEVQQRIAELTADVEENVSGVRVVKAFAREDRQLERFRGQVGRVFDQSMVTTRMAAFYNPFIGFLPQVGLAAILFFGGRQVIRGDLTIGQFSAFYAYLLMLLSPMRTLGISLGLAQRATAAGARLFQILDRAPRIVSDAGAAPLPAGNGHVELRDVTLEYEGAGRPALRDVSLEVPAGTTVALVGATGSGKTTLVQLIPRLYDVTAGAVLVDGADVREVDVGDLRKAVAIVDDNPFLFSATVAENIAYARADAPREEVARAARRAEPRAPPRPGARLPRAPARRLRRARGRARAHAVRRPAPAGRDRARVPRRPAHPDPRRRHVERRRLDRAGDQGRAARGDGRAHDVRHRPPAVDDLARRRDRRAQGRRAARARHARGAARGLRAVPRDRREGPARPGLPHAEAARAEGGGTVSTGADAARAATRRDDLRRRLRGTTGRGRKIRGLVVLLGPYKARVAAMFAALVIGTAASLAPAPLAKTAIDSGILKGDEGTLDIVVLAFIASALIVWGGTFLQTYLVGWVGQRALADLRLQIFRHLQEMPVGFYERRPAGVLISRMTNDVEALDSLVTDTVVTLFQASLTLVGSIVILLALDVKLALITFLIFPVMAAGSLAFRIASADAYRRTRETIGAITAYLQETLSGIRVVRAFHQEPRHRARFGELNETNREANLLTVNLNAAYFPGVEFLSSVATVALLLVGGSQVISGDVQVGVLVRFIAALNGFFDPIGQLSQVYTTYQSGMAALDKIFELLDEQPELRDAPDAIELPRMRGEIRFEDVSFRYGGGHEDGDGERPKLALDHVTMTIPPGQTVALVGATGAGKSTFAKLVARFYDPSDGRVLVDGHDLRTVRAKSLRSQMGIVPQEAFLFSGTVGENIGFGRPDASPAEVEAAARTVGAWDFISALPHGLDTEVGERGVQLSAGQRQLVAFARALIADPRILVLDEATSNVDLHTEGRIEAGLRRLLAGRTAIVIAHRLSTIRQAGRIVVLDHGRIVEQGTHDDLLAAGGAYERLYRDWAEQAAA